MDIYTSPDFAKRAAKEGVSDNDLREAVARAEEGLIDGPLTVPLIKQRIRREGQGRRGGFRAIMAHDSGKRAVFLHLFAKNAKQNLTAAETAVYHANAVTLLGLDAKGYARLTSERGWRQIEDEQPEEDVPK